MERSPPGRRDAAQALFISLKVQAEILEALLREGSLSIDAARPSVALIELTAKIWSREFEEGEAFMAEPLQSLRELLGPQN